MLKFVEINNIVLYPLKGTLLHFRSTYLSSLKLWTECNTFLSVGTIKLDRPTLKEKRSPYSLHCGSPSPVRCLSFLTPSGVSSNCYHNLLTEQAQSLLPQWKFKLVYILSLRDLYFKPNMTWKVLPSYS